MKQKPEATTRKSVTLPDSLWLMVSDYRFQSHITTETEAIRRIIFAGLKAEAKPTRRPGATPGRKPKG